MAVWRGALLVLATAVAVSVLPGLLKPRKPVRTGGFTAKGWEPLQRVFTEHVDRGVLPGGSFAVYHRGQLVAHLYGGYADEEAMVAWRKDTISPFFSSTKAVGAVLMAILVDRGFLDYDEPVAKYWPEFAQNGKETVTVRQLLSHQAGLAAFDEPVSILKLVTAPEEVAKIAAATKPIWRLGDGAGYHGMTLGVYMDELIRRTDPQHRNISQFLIDEIGKPFDADFYIGCPRSEHYRAARLHTMSLINFVVQALTQPEIWPMLIPMFTGGKDHPVSRVMTTFTEMPAMEFSLDNPLIREVPLASSNGYGTTAGIAKIMGVVANGGRLGDKVLMKAETAQKLFQPVVTGIDKVLGLNMTHGVATDIHTSPEGNTIAGNPGSGGQWAMMDPERGLGWAYVSNHQQILIYTDTYTALYNAMYEIVKNIK